MPHQFTQAEDSNLEGIWWKNNGRKFCAWRFDAESRTLKTSRGVVVSTRTLETQSKDLDELKEQLPQMALQLARDIRSGASGASAA